MSLSVNIQKRLGSFTLNVRLESEGGVLGLLGASGSGKTLTLQCIAGIARPDSGRIVLDGVTLFDSERGIDLPPQRRGVGYLFQHYALFPHMTVRQNILCGLHGVKGAAQKQAEVRRVTALLQLQGLENLRPHQLSGGQQQRAALGRILVTHPRILLLDEPFSALDSHLRGKLQLEMRTLLAAYGRDVLLVTHSRTEAYRLCAATAVLDAGRVLACQPTPELFADPGSVRAALLTGCKNIAPARKVGEYEVEVPDWGIRLQTARPVGDTVRAVGIRAHAFTANAPAAAANVFPVAYVGEMAEPFEWVLQFRFAAQPPGAAPLWWRLPKESRPPVFPAALAVAPHQVLLLYE